MPCRSRRRADHGGHACRRASRARRPGLERSRSTLDFSCATKHYRVRRGDTLSLDRATLQHDSRRPRSRELARSERRAAGGLVLVIPQSGCAQPHAAPSPPRRDTTRRRRSSGRSPCRVSLERTGVVVVDLDSNTVVYTAQPGYTARAGVDREAPARDRGSPAARRRVSDEDGCLVRARRPGRPGAAISSSRAHGDPALTSGGPDRAGTRCAREGSRPSAVASSATSPTLTTHARRRVETVVREERVAAPLGARRRPRPPRRGRGRPPRARRGDPLSPGRCAPQACRCQAPPDVGTAPPTAVELARRASPPLTTLLSRWTPGATTSSPRCSSSELGARLAGRGSSSSGAGRSLDAGGRRSAARRCPARRRIRPLPARPADRPLARRDPRDDLARAQAAPAARHVRGRRLDRDAAPPPARHSPAISSSEERRARRMRRRPLPASSARGTPSSS